MGVASTFRPPGTAEVVDAPGPQGPGRFVVWSGVIPC
jgi:hypothetical protein